MHVECNIHSIIKAPDIAAKHQNELGFKYSTSSKKTKYYYCVQLVQPDFSCLLKPKQAATGELNRRSFIYQVRSLTYLA